MAGGAAAIISHNVRDIRRGSSVNKRVEEMSAQALAAWDTENRLRALAAQGDVPQAPEVLDRLDAST